VAGSSLVVLSVVESLAAVGEGRGKRDEMWEETNEGHVWECDFNKCDFKNCVFKNCVFEIVTF
jgi:hypothetical protein